MELGVVVSDLDRAADFYSEVVGMTEVQGFKAPAKVATDFGLTDNHPVVVRKFVLAEVKDCPGLKLMAFPKAEVAKPDQKFIHSTLGFSYLTLFVNDMGDAVARAEKAGVKILGKTPAKVGANNYLTVYKDPDGNFIELIGPAKTNLERFKGNKPEPKEASFFNAAKDGDVAALKTFLDKGQDIDEKQNDNVMAIGLAALFGQTDALKFLIEKGAEVNVQTKDGGTPLHGPSFFGRIEVVETLIAAGADVNIKNKQGLTPFDECSEPWNDSIAEKVDHLNAMIDLKVDVDEVKSGRLKVLALLKKHGAKSGSE